ncbi:MAG: dipeptidase [Oscillospiraceae bacterium]|jgi:membrane dipeptidase|nr:dipeptidase [Oscillospiraceae bacterium]
MHIPVFDAHCDTIFEAEKHRCGLRENRLQVDLRRGLRYTPYAQVFAVFTRPQTDWENADFSKDRPPELLKNIGFALLGRLLYAFEANADILTLCRSAAEIRKTAEQGRAAGLIAVEGAELLGSDTAGLELAYEKGVRLVNLCWNFDNPLCGAANGPTKSGLTDRGRAYVERMQALGIAVDLSHASERTFWDTAALMKRPMLAGHSNAKAVCDHPRNLTDGQFRELIRQGGAAGLNLCRDFLNASGRAGIEDVLRHAEHFLALGGEKALCLGGDLDGIDRPPSGITGIESYGEIYEALLRRNYPEALVRDIFYNNLLAVLERAL